MSWIEVGAASGRIQITRGERCSASGRSEYEKFHHFSIEEAERHVEAVVASIAEAKTQRNESMKKRRVELNEKKTRLANELMAIAKELGDGA